MRRIAILLLSILLIIANGNRAYGATRKTLTVFAASSLTDAFTEIKTVFEVAYPEVVVVYNFGASSTLASQLKEGAPADIFASANNSQMKVVTYAGLIDEVPQIFARNRLVLAVPINNPGKIMSIRDLAKPGIKLIVAAPEVPVRDYTDAMLDKLAEIPEYGDTYKQAVISNVVSEEDNVRQVAAKVALGEADAGIVYRSDITPDISDKIVMIMIPDEVNTIAMYPIAILKDSPNAELAKAFIQYVLSEKGQATLSKWNFIPIVIAPEHEIMEF
jgi:molybdate transport system substrate-binding protein